MTDGEPKSNKRDPNFEIRSGGIVLDSACMWPDRCSRPVAVYAGFLALLGLGRCDGQLMNKAEMAAETAKTRP